MYDLGQLLLYFRNHVSYNSFQLIQMLPYFLDAGDNLPFSVWYFLLVINVLVFF